MRKVTFGGANSLDNFIARNDGAVDWLLWSDEAMSVMTEFWKTIDAVLWGRKTYEVAKGGLSSYKSVKHYVFSRTLKETADKNAEIISEDAAEFVRKLKRKRGKGIFVMGGGLLARSLFEADLIDELRFNIHPVLLGQGIPLFHEMSHQINLELIDCKVFENGCVQVSYRVKH